MLGGMKHAIAIAAALAASPAIADYTNHQHVRPFTEAPCIDVLGALDVPNPTITQVMNMAMRFGFILGFDTALGGLQGDDETTLVRLRKACAENRDATAEELLRSFARP